MANDMLVIDIIGPDGVSSREPTLVRVRWLRRVPREVHAVIGVLAASLIALVDWVTGPEATMALLYVFVVMAVTWLGTRRYGYLIAVLAAAESLGAHLARRGHAALPVAVWNASVRLGVLLTIAWLLCRLRAAIVTQRRHAAVDPLTGALNRRAFQEAAERERLRSLRDASPLSVAYLDIDNFKPVNDRYGHRAGDRILRSLGSSIRHSIRGSDLLARIGGDEFVLLLPNTDAGDAAAALQRVRGSLESAEESGSMIRLSIGIATFRVPPMDVDTMVDEADTLMYRAKRLGGNRTVGAVISGPWTAWSPGRMVDVQITGAMEKAAG